MEYNQLGNAKIAKITLGLDKLGLQDGEKFNVLADEYLRLGGNSFDTARIYSMGESEQLLGTYLAKRGIRKQIFLATKIGFPDRENNWKSRINAKDLEEDIRASLNALKTDCVDLCWLHRDDETKPIGEIMEIMNVLAKKGYFRRFGASNFSASRIAAGNAYAEACGMAGFSASQIQWSAAVTDEAHYGDIGIRVMNAEEYEGYRFLKIPVFCYAPLAGGYFQKTVSGLPISEKILRRFDCEENRRRAGIAKELSEQINKPISAVALSYLIHNALPAVAITGAKTVKQLQENMTACTCTLGCPSFDFYCGNEAK